MLKRTLVALSALITLPAFSAWQMDPAASSLNFLSTKNAQITEVHKFTELTGHISDAGQLSVSVALASVDTGIPIRDTRMKEKLFEVSNFANATFIASLPDSVKNLAVGESAVVTVDGTLDLHGMNAPISFTINATRVNDNTLSATTVAPTILMAKDFDLVGGLETLQSIAGLKSITFSVPVTFSVTFTQ